MKAIGLIGGMSWESTALYYRIVNREVGRRLGGLRSAKLHLASLDFEEIAAAQKAGAWDVLATQLAGVARTLERAGAECVLIGTNTMHCVAEAVQAAVSIPLLHIVDVTAAAIHESGCRSVALLGTRYTMEQQFYVERLARHDITCVIPGTDDRAEVHRVIFDELCKGHVNAESRRRLQAIVRQLRPRGAEGVILGCTELSLALTAHDVDMPLFDTTELHALAAVAFALGDEWSAPPLRPEPARVLDGLRRLEPAQSSDQNAWRSKHSTVFSAPVTRSAEGTRQLAIAKALEAHAHKRPGRIHASRIGAERPENGWAMFMTLLLLLPATAFAMWGPLWIAAWFYALSLWPCAGLDFRRR